MEDICEICGLPKNICVCKDISMEQQKIKIKTWRRRFGKYVTVISGFDNENTAKEIGKSLKKKFACGGTVKGDKVELQGNHSKNAKEFLLKQGYKEELIDA